MKAYKIGVLADSHGDTWALKKILFEMNDLEMVIFLGDVSTDVVTIREILQQRKNVPKLLAVRGNNDLSTSLPDSVLIDVQKRRIMACHGHLYGVSYGIERLVEEARKKQASIVLYGHTHRPYCSMEKGIFVLNPGSVHGNRGSFTRSASILVLEEHLIHTEDVVI